ncbi:DNA-protecting protein DprA [Streptomyces sp. MUM 203J]|uniref:DNA-processing protein DprA n=1 Tax=Streptomyces sp. MUM 203J TaxID=2791990 RepID=UPI001F040A4E|nr:DNA-processing protein DprA [Streptomyces sp. MUM 203J]MCH0541233.1 DNA-protecting protein DprA [Streptomyces sp. MUM 203J]
MPAPDEERRARAALCRIIEPGDEHGGRWLRELGARELLYRLTTHPYRPGSLPGAGERRVQGLLRRAARSRPDQDLEAVRALGGRFVVPGDREWPSQLDDLGDARPLGLWVRGTQDLRRWALRSVALVGARACTAYGAHMAADLGAGLAERGWVVVSGAAFGIDAAAHRGTLGAGGATVAVLACGVDVPYPRGHDALIRRIAQQGLVIGELAPGEHPTPSRFLLRNRVIAALTRGTVVVEAAHRSGALATARDAQHLGRHTMGVPGPATSGLSAGVHELLRGGATLVSDADDVTELVGAIGDLAPARRGPVLPRDLLDPETARVLEALPPPGRPVTLSDLATTAGTDVDDTLGRLYELHSLGYARREGDRWYLVRTAAHAPNNRRGGA